MAASPSHPRPFRYSDNNPGTKPDLSDGELGNLTTVLKGLAKGNYPRLDAVPLALNAYNCNRTEPPQDSMWAYFHDIIDMTPPRGGKARKAAPVPVPSIELDDDVLDDLEVPWQTSLREERAGAVVRERIVRAEGSAKYRLVCFIHHHRIELKDSLQRAVYTISIYDRESHEITWHDTYPVDRVQRRKAVRLFWSHVEARGFTVIYPRDEFLRSRLAFRTKYRTCTAIEHTIRVVVAPRHTLWSVMAIAIHHMNEIDDPFVSIVPDRMELFGGQAKQLLPQFFAHLLRLCLDCNPAWKDDDKKRFVARFKITEKLGWMGFKAREFLLPHLRAVHDGSSDDSSSSDGEETGLPAWTLEVLKIPEPE